MIVVDCDEQPGVISHPSMISGDAHRVTKLKKSTDALGQLLVYFVVEKVKNLLCTCKIFILDEHQGRESIVIQ